MSELKGPLLFGLAFFLFWMFVAFVKVLWSTYKDRKEDARLAYTHPAREYLILRKPIFDGSLARDTVPAEFPPDEPWAVLMDWGTKNAIATIVAFTDGTASMYYSSGGATLGGGQADPAIRAAAKNALAVVARTIARLRLVTEFPTPKQPGQVYFYVLTRSGVYFGEGTQNELGTSQHPLSELGNAMQAIITGYRLHRPPRK